ncbi:transporter substrate-binding domain-containing protein [Ancylobacter pratisalsi]|uniref:Transporter substrate-binding domain-containing protein n=1 Tax=Ancylobacter pratisalsi TaxID=1745854 RepID=A0A6P1YLM1_9HYPH|nr:transporter substrate-binding domain-containing protein [Ancylobacter pratisalsi]QIB33133.1 transporter substrate-binding domain-containing protein [Ancylobacter pratisalsi]
MIHRRAVSIFACAFSLSLLAGTAYAKDGVLRIGTEGDAPLFSMVDATGNVTGFDADIANGICAELKLKCEFVVQTFSTLVPSMDSDRFDVIISGLGITDERRKKIDYSIPYASTPLYFAIAKSSPVAELKDLPSILKALSGKTVGVVNGTTYAKFVAKNVPNVDLKTYDSTTAQLADLGAGRLDAAFGDSPTWTEFLATPEGAGFTRVDVRVKPGDDHASLGYGMGVGLKKGNDELKAKLDKALCNMLTSGKVKAASIQWFKEDYSLTCSQ